MIRKIIRWISGLAIFAIVCFVVWFALVNYNVIDNPYETKAELISLSQSEIRLKKKNTYQLSASLVPSNVRNGIVSYSSSNPNVATVNEASGFIYAVSNGTTTITATLKSNKNIKADCTVIVSDNDFVAQRTDVDRSSIHQRVFLTVREILVSVEDLIVLNHPTGYPLASPLMIVASRDSGVTEIFECIVRYDEIRPMTCDD